MGIIYEYNRFGPLRSGALGNNLKDRSAGLVVRYNWIESGNRQLDLVESGTAALYNDNSYASTYAYGNILIEPDGAGNSQIVHYGGDNGTTARYRKGNFYFYNNTVISTRSGNTTLARLSTQDETMHAFNNVIYNTSTGNRMAMLNGDGSINVNYNWIKTNWVNAHSGSGTVNDQGNNITGSDPLFNDFANQDFGLQSNSPLVNAGAAIPAIHLPIHDVSNEYVKHSSSTTRTIVNGIDIGAFERQAVLSTTNIAAPTMVLYPNPSSTSVCLKNVNPNAIQTISVYSSTGQLLLQSNQVELDISALESGVYFITVQAIGAPTTFTFVKS